MVCQVPSFAPTAIVASSAGRLKVFESSLPFLAVMRATLKSCPIDLPNSKASSPSSLSTGDSSSIDLNTFLSLNMLPSSATALTRDTVSWP